MTREDLYRSMGAIDEDILLRSENAGKNHSRREVSLEAGKTGERGRKTGGSFWFGKWVAVAAVLCVGILIGVIGKTVWTQKNRQQQNTGITPSAKPTGEATPIPTPSATPELTGTPTPTPEPTPTPTETPEPESGDVLDKAIRTYESEHAAEIKAHKEQYHKELRESFKDVPVQKFNLLKTVTIDGHYTAEIYESAIFGYASAWKEEEGWHEYTGIDKNRELYDYKLIGRLLEDGQYVRDTSKKYAGDYPYGETQIMDFVGWRTPDDPFTEAVCKMAGLPYERSEVTVRTVKTETWVTDNYTHYYSACYLNGSSTPVISTRYFGIMSNDGGTDEEHYILSDGTEFTAASLKKVKNGEGFLSDDVAEWPFDGKNVSWTLFETKSGEQILFLYTDDFGETQAAATSYYIYVNKCLIEFSSSFDL